MRKISKNFSQTPTLLLQCAQDKQAKLLEQADRHNFDERCYNHAVIDDLRRIYFDKCAYCEIKFPETKQDKIYKLIGATVEHYRPKKNGYYWLGYEWTNLMLVCEACNHTKGDKFDIKGSKVKKPPCKEDGSLDMSKCSLDSPELLNEKPLLINPELDIPSDWFYFTKSGELKAKDNNDRADYTIKTIQLNREALWILQRKKLIDALHNDLEQQIRYYLEYYAKKPIEEGAIALAFFDIFEKLVAMQDEKAEFTFLGKEMLSNFNSFFIEPIGNNFGQEVQKLITYAFEMFLQKHTIN